MTLSGFERDVVAQGGALRAFARSLLPDGLERLLQGPYDRVVLTGMGSSHFASLPTWRSLVAHGRAAWSVDTGRLLDVPGLVTPDTLLIATSQSGASAEIATLLSSSSPITRPRHVVGVTNDPSSPLARHSDAVIDLHIGAEATVSTKSYVNSLAAHQRLLGVLTGAGADTGAMLDVAAFMERFDPGDVLTDAAHDVAVVQHARVAMIGNREHAATALYAGLITKEAAKVPAEGFVGGQFRHGPLELAGPGLTVVLFGVFADDPSPSMRGLAADLIRSGSRVLLVGDVTLDGADTIVTRRADALGRLCAGALVAQRFAVEIARARGIEPGVFTYGSKVTTAL